MPDDYGGGGSLDKIASSVLRLGEDVALLAGEGGVDVDLAAGLGLAVGLASGSGAGVAEAEANFSFASSSNLFSSR